jgi:hypothetical protein
MALPALHEAFMGNRVFLKIPRPRCGSGQAARRLRSFLQPP